jgi:hypothetical protein
MGYHAASPDHAAIPGGILYLRPRKRRVNPPSLARAHRSAFGSEAGHATAMRMRAEPGRLAYESGDNPSSSFLVPGAAWIWAAADYDGTPAFSAIAASGKTIVPNTFAPVQTPAGFLD